MDLLDDSNYIDGQINLLREVKEIKNPNKILFIDFFNPGMDLIRYYHQQTDLKCKYGALLHGGTFLEDDLYSFDWLNKFEIAWSNLYDCIYVPSIFNKKILPQAIKDKAIVIPWGMDNFKKQTSQNKKYDVIFPHRINSDKGIIDLIFIIKKLPEVNFVITIPQKISLLEKNKYYTSLSTLKNVEIIELNTGKNHLKILSQSKIILSCAKQETFGYSIMKGVLSGCIPILPNGLCYPEFFDKKYLYLSKIDCIEKIKYFLMNYDSEIKNKALEKNKISIKKFSFKTIIEDFFNKTN
jgi:glycosyltransferase involved in cell wall biosynthesis